MRLVCSSAALNEGLQIAARAMSTRTANPILEGILLEARMGQLRITASDERLTILTRVECEVAEARPGRHPRQAVYRHRAPLAGQPHHRDRHERALHLPHRLRRVGDERGRAGRRPLPGAAGAYRRQRVHPAAGQPARHDRKDAVRHRRGRRPRGAHRRASGDLRRRRHHGRPRRLPPGLQARQGLRRHGRDPRHHSRPGGGRPCQAALRRRGRLCHPRLRQQRRACRCAWRRRTST